MFAMGRLASASARAPRDADEAIACLGIDLAMPFRNKLQSIVDKVFGRGDAVQELAHVPGRPVTIEDS